MKARIFRILEGDATDDPWGRRFSIFIVGLIIANVITLSLGTVETVAVRYATVLELFEWFSVIVFTLEYALRLWSAPTDARYRGAVSGRLRFMITPLAIADVLAIAPTYIALTPLGAALDLRFLRILRLFRFMRLLKLGRYSQSLRMLRRVIRSRREHLTLSLVVVFVLLILASGLIYMAEHDAQPDVFSSIPASMWWAIITLTTVGYGDVHPVTTLGRLVGAVTALLGIAAVALPTAILASGFQEEVERGSAEEEGVCPHCGRLLDAETDTDPGTSTHPR